MKQRDKQSLRRRLFCSRFAVRSAGFSERCIFGIDWSARLAQNGDLQ